MPISHNSIIIDLDQTVITITAQATRRTAAELRVTECKELMMTMRAASNTKDISAAAATEAVKVKVNEGEDNAKA